MSAHLSIIPDKHCALWSSCGWARLTRNGDGHLLLTDDFLRQLLTRPELCLVPESCAAEAALHARWQSQPRYDPSPAELGAIADPDARENLAVWLRFRARLLAAPSLEAAYMALFRDSVDVAPALVAVLTQAIVANVLSLMAGPESEVDGLQARAAELLFRTQTISIQQENEAGHTVMAADLETVERQALSGGFGSLGELLRQGGATLRTIDLDVLSRDNAGQYLAGCERFDTVLNLNHGQASQNALCRVLEAWVAHFLGTPVGIVVSREIDDDRWVWHVGLDAQASAVLNALYQGQDVDDAASQRMLCLFTLNFTHAHDMRAEIAGRPVYLAMAMDTQKRLQLKPQNLLLNLPLAQRS